MPVLTSAALGRDQATAVDFDEVTVSKLVSRFGVFGLLFVDAQMPLRVLGEAVPVDEFIFLLRGRLVFTPCVAVVVHEFSVLYQRLRMLECLLVQCYGHSALTLES